MRRSILLIASLLVVVACGDSASVAADPERFCEIDAELDQLEDPLELDEAAARAEANKGRDLIDEASRVAPGEISAEVKIQADGFRQIIDAFEDANFDATQIDDIEAIFDDALSDEAIAAIETIEDWIAANCST